MAQYGMLIDTHRCFGCQTCVVACKFNNQITADNYWSRVESGEGMEVYQAKGSYPNCQMTFVPLLCNHCTEPLCVAQCPTGAMSKNEETGIVTSDHDMCIGCGTCVQACPYEMPVLDADAGYSTKCTLCTERTAEGEEPYCVECCPGRARIFGDVADANSEISKQIKERQAKPVRTDFGTEPNMYYC